MSQPTLEQIENELVAYEALLAAVHALPASSRDGTEQMVLRRVQRALGGWAATIPGRDPVEAIKEMVRPCIGMSADVYAADIKPHLIANGIDCQDVSVSFDMSRNIVEVFVYTSRGKPPIIVSRATPGGGQCGICGQEPCDYHGHYPVPAGEL